MTQKESKQKVLPSINSAPNSKAHQAPLKYTSSNVPHKYMQHPIHIPYMACFTSKQLKFHILHKPLSLGMSLSSNFIK